MFYLNGILDLDPGKSLCDHNRTEGEKWPAERKLSIVSGSNVLIFLAGITNILPYMHCFEEVMKIGNRLQLSFKSHFSIYIPYMNEKVLRVCNLAFSHTPPMQAEVSAPLSFPVLKVKTILIKRQYNTS